MSSPACSTIANARTIASSIHASGPGPSTSSYAASRRVGDQQVHVVGLPVELDQFGVELDAHAAHGVLGEGEHGVGEHRAPVVGYEYEVGV